MRAKKMDPTALIASASDLDIDQPESLKKTGVFGYAVRSVYTVRQVIGWLPFVAGFLALRVRIQIHVQSQMRLPAVRRRVLDGAWAIQNHRNEKKNFCAPHWRSNHAPLMEYRIVIGRCNLPSRPGAESPNSTSGYSGAKRRKVTKKGEKCVGWLSALRMPKHPILILVGRRR